MIYLLATLFTLGLAQQDTPACVMTDCGVPLQTCMGDLIADAQGAGFTCLINQDDATCNACLMSAVVDGGMPACYADDCPVETLPCFAENPEDTTAMMTCLSNTPGVDNACVACIASAEDPNESVDSHEGHDHSEDEECMMTDCGAAVIACASFFGDDDDVSSAEEAAGVACLVAQNDDTCNTCLMTTASQDGAPDCYSDDCPISTMTCFFSGESDEEVVGNCIKALNPGTDCETCVDNFLEEQKKENKKNAAAAVSMVAAFAVSLLALF